MEEPTEEQFCLITNLALLRNIDRSLANIFECDLITLEQLTEIRAATYDAILRHEDRINYQHR